jgi:transcription-repair coupling factor (superfamily II helicase)
LTHPGIRDLFTGLGRHPAFLAAVQQLKTGDACLAGLTETAKAIYITLLLQAAGRPVVVVTDTPQRAESLAGNAATFAGFLVSGREQLRPQLLPGLDSLPWRGLAPHAEIAEQRATGLWRLATGRAPLTILPAASAMLRVAPAAYYRQLALTLQVNDEIPGMTCSRTWPRSAISAAIPSKWWVSFP